MNMYENSSRAAVDEHGVAARRDKQPIEPGTEAAVPPLADVSVDYESDRQDGLPSGISQRCRNLIYREAETPLREDTLLDVCRELIRCGLDDDAVRGIVTDTNYGISADVIRRGAQVQSYARQLIKRAREDVENPLVLDPDDPYTSAQAFVERVRPPVKCYNGEWLEHDGSAWVKVEEQTIKARMFKFLSRATVSNGRTEDRSFKPTPEKVAMVMGCLTLAVHVDGTKKSLPFWLDDRDSPRPDEMVACRNGLLHLPTGDLHPPDERFFTRHAVGFNYDPEASCDRFLEFLKEAFPNDDEQDCIDAIQEYMGYIIAGDTSQQKALMLVGVPRAGKGVLTSVMTELVGRNNTASPTLDDLIGKFGLASLLSKKLAVISDMRISGKSDQVIAIEHLLRITGEDRVTVNRKYKEAIETLLDVRFVITTNELPAFTDRSGALPGRFIVIQMNESFFGREDTQLKDKLLEELPGIFNWAVEGWRRLRERGRITQPEVGEELVRQMVDLASPITAFARDRCELAGDAYVSKDELFEAFKRWHVEELGSECGGVKNWFFRNMKSAIPGVKTDAKRDGSSKRVCSGLRLKKHGEECT